MDTSSINSGKQLTARRAAPAAAVESAGSSRLPQPRSPRYKSLDMWRGLACLLVVVFHSTFYVATPENEEGLAGDSLQHKLAAATARMWIGVPIFFVISGYCISATADSTRLKNVSTASYFLRRFRRIYPPYWICFAVMAAIVGGTEYFLYPGFFADGVHRWPPPWELDVSHFIGNITLTETWLQRLLGNSDKLFLGYAWTLCYEEQFYAIVGLSLLLARRRFFTCMAVISVIVLILRFTCDANHVKGWFFDGRWLLFACGICCYYDINYASRREAIVLRSALAAGLTWAAFPLGALIAYDWNAKQQCFVACAFALAITGLHRYDAQLCRSAWLRPIEFCGKICYSLYLTHWLVAKCVSHLFAIQGFTSPASLLLVVPVSVSTAILVGWIFHQLVERHFLNRPQGDLAPGVKAC